MELMRYYIGLKDLQNKTNLANYASSSTMLNLLYASLLYPALLFQNTSRGK